MPIPTRVRCHAALKIPSFKGLFTMLILSGLFGCYPLSLTDARWAIEWDTALMEGKQAWLADTIQTVGSPEGKQLPNTMAPNVVLIVCDDLGKNEVSAYGGGPVPTPNIDRLGASGVVFDAGYVTSPTCAPSRAGLMTGRIQNRYGFESQMIEGYPGNAVEFLAGRHLLDMDGWMLTNPPPFPTEEHRHRQGIPASEITLAEALKKYGYHNGVVGKWHMGVAPEQLPLARGFDVQYGFLGAFSMYAPEHTPGIVDHKGQDFAVRYQWRRGRKGEGAIARMGEEIEEDRYLTFAIRDEAIDFIEHNHERPFFLHCAFSAPHVPFQAPQEYVDRFAHEPSENKRVYYAMIAALDDAIGAIYRRIEALDLAEQTMIVLLSDNGGATYTDATDNGPWKGGKLTQFEGGINVPFMLSWPGRVPAGERYPHPISATDILPTAMAAAGGTLPKDRIYDGVNLLPFLNGQMGEARPHERLFWRCDHIWAIRDGDYKLILSARDGWAELYHLAEDRYETINLASDMPELMATLRRLHAEWQEDNLPPEPLWPRLVDHRFVIDGRSYRFPS